jgi:hypothetical protein
MHKRRYSGTVERLRMPERLALLEVDRVVNLAMKGSVSTTVLDVRTGSVDLALIETVQLNHLLLFEFAS